MLDSLLLLVPIEAMPESAQQDRFLTIRATDTDRAVVKAEAQRRGLTQAQLVRQALINAGVPLQSAA
jgi:predicted DNA binding CopG/RHH family protein